MNRALFCVHCGAVVELEPGPESRRLRRHLLGLHADIVLLDEVSRWNELLEHFRVVPQRQQAAIPRVVELL